MNRNFFSTLALVILLSSPALAQEPWLPAEEQKKILQMMPKGVPIGKNLKFYRCQPVYQKMYTMNNGASKFNDITPSVEVDPWRASGGLHHVDASAWRNVTGLDLTGEIDVWQEDTDVRAFSLVPKWRWRFPQGTKAYDVLIRIKDGKEHIFEVRVQEKLEDRWDSGTIYRPQVKKLGPDRYSWTWGFPSEGLSAEAVTHHGTLDPKAPFVATRKLVVDDGNFTPPNYAGAGMSCNACHGRVGELYDVPGQIYREARRGDDGRFSWHPFDDYGRVDVRWPIRRRY